MAYVEVFSRSLIAVVFLLSAWSKRPVGNRFEEFAGSLAAMRVLGARSVRPVAGLVVAAEAAVPVLLLALPWPGFVVAGGLLLGFCVAIVVVLRRGTAAECRCFGGARPARFRWHHVVRNAALIAVAGAGVVAVAAGPALPWPVVAVMAPPGLIVAVLVAHIDDLVDLFAPVRASG
jgi:hypothetical protein